MKIKIDETLIENLKKVGYTIYKMKDGKVWLSRGCPKCSKDKFLIVDMK